MVGDPARQGFRSSAEKRRAGTANNEEPRAIRPPIHRYAKQPEEVLAPLDLIDDDHAIEGLKRKFRFDQAGLIGRSLQIEECNRALLARGEGAGKSRHPQLAGTHEPDDGEPP